MIEFKLKLVIFFPFLSFLIRLKSVNFSFGNITSDRTRDILLHKANITKDYRNTSVFI